MSKGADLENSSLEWLLQLRGMENGSVGRTNRVLAVGAQRVLGELSGAYKKLQDSQGTSNRYVAQQAQARLNAIGDLLPAKQQAQLVEAQKRALADAQALGRKSGVDLARIDKNGSLTLKQNAQPNTAAVENAGRRLNDFWAKENQTFRDRVTAMTQVALVEGKSYRNLAAQVRQLLVMEQQQGTESKRSQKVNQKMGISQRAEVIARTEMQAAFVQGQMANYRQLGYEWARWSAAGERTCGYCMSRDGLIYEMEDIEGQIPAHPRCRCTVIPVEKPPGIGKNKPNQLQADEFLDDKYWQKSRKEKLDDWKKEQNISKRTGKQKAPELLKSNSELDQALRRYERTPTNQQEYLRPGSDAPPAKWKPGNDTIPDLVKAQKAALKELNALVKAQKRALNESTKDFTVKKRPGETETFKKYSNANGAEPGPDTVWTPERQKLHNEILDHFLKDGVVSQNPTFTMSGGGPASGKGFMLKKTGLDQPGKVVLDADEIKKLIPEYANAQKKGGKAQQKAASVVHEESSYLAKKLMAEAANRGYDVVLDGTGDNGLKSLKKKVDAMREKGYRVDAKYVSADTDLAAQRNWDRFLKTGRLPPEHMLRNVHRDVSRTLPEAMDADLFDSVELYDTNKSGELRMVAHKTKGQKTVIDNKQLWDDFKAKGEADTWTAEQGDKAIRQRKLKENPKAKDTLARHSDARAPGAEPGPDTAWTADRQKLHDDIVAKFLKDGVKSKDPTFTMSGGGPASGKGFMLKKTGLDKPGKVVVDSDEIKKLLPEYNEMQKAGGAKAKKAAGYVHEESSYLAKRVMDAAADAGFDVILDGTGDNGLKSLKKKVDKMKAKGYKVEAKYVSADTEVAAQRNWERFLKTGRLPPESMLRNVHRDVSRTLPDALDADLFDKVDLYDTNKSGELRKVISKTKGQKTQVHDDVLWDRFLRKADAETFTSADDARLTAAQEKRMPKLPDAPAKPKAEPKPKKALPDRIEDKFIEPPSAKIKKGDFTDGLKALKAQGGDVGRNVDRLMGFQERYNISTITGTGNEKPGYFLQSKQLQSSLAAAQARKTSTDKFGYGNDKVFAEALREMRSSTLEVNQPTARANFKVSKTPGVGGSTADGMGAVKIKVSKHHQKLTPERLKELQQAVEKSVIDSAAGKPHVLTSHSTFNTKVKGAKSEVDWFTNYIHEMGHQIHYAVGQPMANSVAAMNWKPSKYGSTNKQEWFAETFTQYTLAPEALKKHAPKAYKFVDDMVKRSMAGRPGEVGRAEALGLEAPQRTIKEDLVSLKGKTVKQLQAEAKGLGLKGYSKLKKPELEALLDKTQQNKNVDIAASVMADKKFKSDKARIAEMVKRGVPPGSDFTGLVAQAKQQKGLKTTDTFQDPKPKAKAKPAAAKPKTVAQLKAQAKAQGVKGYSGMKKAELEAALAKPQPKKAAGITKKPSAKAAAKPAAKKVSDFTLVNQQLGLSKAQWDAKSDSAKKLALKTAQKKAQKNKGKSLKQLQEEVKAAQKAADEAQKKYEKTIENIAENKGKLKAEAYKSGKGSGQATKQARIDDLTKEIKKLSQKALEGTYTKADGLKVKQLQAERDALQDQLKPKDTKPKKLPKTTDDIDFMPDPTDFEQYGFKSEREMDELFETVDHWSGNGYKNIRKNQIAAAKKAKLTEYERGMVDRYNKSKDADWAGDEAMARDLETYLKNAPKYQGEVRRGQVVDNPAAAEALLKQMNGGRPSLALESWTNDPKTANNFATGKESDRKWVKGNIGLVFKMQNKHGSPIASMSGLGHENEVLMPSGVKTKIKKVTKKTVRGKEIWEVELVSF